LIKTISAIAEPFFANVRLQVLEPDQVPAWLGCGTGKESKESRRILVPRLLKDSDLLAQIPHQIADP
jgi:hypothetical protein